MIFFFTVITLEDVWGKKKKKYTNPGDLIYRIM